MHADLPIEVTLEVRDTCLCFRTQRAARALARRFDRAFASLGLTHGQFSLMMALNQPSPPPSGKLADFLGMDRTSLTAKLKVVIRNGWVMDTPDDHDRRNRRLALTDEGRDILKTALPIWRDHHRQIDQDVLTGNADLLKQALDELSTADHDDKG